MPCEQIHIDFVTELPEDNGYGTIMMWVEHFSKMVVLVPLCELDVQTVTNCLIAKVMSHHGLLVTIISNRDPRFQSNFWEELIVQLNNSLLFSTTSYP